MPDMPSIPSPRKDNMDERYEAILALKMAVEMLMGTRGGNPTSRTFVQTTMPMAFNVGDTWVNSNSGKMSYWNGKQWLSVV